MANAMRGPEWSQFMAAERSAQRHIIAIGVVAGADRIRVVIDPSWPDVNRMLLPKRALVLEIVGRASGDRPVNDRG